MAALRLLTASVRLSSTNMGRFYSSVGPLTHEDLKEELQHATGREAAELESTLQGKELYGPTVLTGAFGTRENPVVVPSFYINRIVGCKGSGEHPHELRWHVVGNDRPTVCLCCGQFFVVDRCLKDDHHHDDHHHDDHHHHDGNCAHHAH